VSSPPEPASSRRRGVLTLALVATIVAVSLVGLSLGGGGSVAAARLGLVPARALGDEPWRLITWAFVHPSVTSLLAASLAIGLFLRPVEATLGAARAALFVTAAVVVPGIITAAVGRALAPQAVVVGAVPIVAATLVLFGAVHRDTAVLFFGLQPMRGSTAAGLAIAVLAVYLVMAGAPLPLTAGAAGLAVGAGTVLLRRLASARASAADGRRTLRRRIDEWRRRRRRRRYRVIDGGRRGPAPMPPSTTRHLSF
jgi:membrane associated rhomboid family serine protease